MDAVPFDDAGWLPKPGTPNKDYVRTIFGFNTKQPYFSDANEPSNEDQSRLVDVCVCVCSMCVCLHHGCCSVITWEYVRRSMCVRVPLSLSLSLSLSHTHTLSLSLSPCVLISMCVCVQALINAGVNVGAEGIMT